jgi:Ca-activated chloride channel family protein
MISKTPKVEMLLQKTKLVAGVDKTVDLLLRITPPEAEMKARPQLNIGIVLDRSGSMGGEKMANAREASRFCINELVADDKVSVVIFDDRIDVLVPNQRAKNKDHFKTLIDKIEARGSTALHEAWVRGGMEVSSDLVARGINRVLLITDGLANVGLTSTDEIVSQARGLNERGVSTSTIGIGDDFNEELLVPMAESAGGNAWHAKSGLDLKRVFDVELQGLVAQFAHSVSLGLIPTDGVEVVEVLNDFEDTETGRYKLPNLQAGNPLEVVARLKVPAQAAGTKLRLADVRLGYTRQDSTSGEVVKEFLEVEFANADEVESLPSNPDVVAAVTLLNNARARREAVKYMDAGEFEEARGIMVARMAATQAARDIAPDSSELAHEVSDFVSLSEAVGDVESVKSNRKRLRYDAYSRQRNSRKP